MIDFLHNHIVLVVLLACGIAVVVPGTVLGGHFVGKYLRGRDLRAAQRARKRGFKKPVRAAATLRRTSPLHRVSGTGGLRRGR
jgi:hypothetical protein